MREHRWSDADGSVPIHPKCVLHARVAHYPPWHGTGRHNTLYCATASGNNLSKVQDMDDFQTSALLLHKKGQTAENVAVLNEDRSLQRGFGEALPCGVLRLPLESKVPTPLLYFERKGVCTENKIEVGTAA